MAWGARACLSPYVTGVCRRCLGELNCTHTYVEDEQGRRGEKRESFDVNARCVLGSTELSLQQECVVDFMHISAGIGPEFHDTEGYRG